LRAFSEADTKKLEIPLFLGVFLEYTPGLLQQLKEDFE